MPSAAAADQNGSRRAVVELELPGARRNLDAAQAEPVRALELARGALRILERHRGERREAPGMPARDRGERVVVHLGHRERGVRGRVGVEHEGRARDRLHVDAEAIHVGQPRGRVAHARVQRAHGLAPDLREAPFARLHDARIEVARPRARGTRPRPRRPCGCGDRRVHGQRQTPKTRNPVDTHEARAQVTSSLRLPIAPAPTIQLRSSWSPFASSSGLS